MTALDQAFIRAYTPATLPMTVPTESPVVESSETTRSPMREESPVEVPVVQSTAVAEERFLAGYQVDQFTWSLTAGKLSLSAGIQLDRLADGLAAGLAKDQKVIGLGACCQGEGCTTLLLCAARRLAQRGLRVLMVDADFDHPCLARRVGLMPETGWEDVLTGRVSAAEAIVESTQDRLAILPLRGLPAEQHFPAGIAVDPGASLNALREHYDLVLVDLGELSETGTTGRRLETVAPWVDAAVLVHNVRATPQAALMQTRTRLQEAGIVEVGIAENFV